MEIYMIVIIVIVGFIILSIGGGLGYWFWLSTRPKKMTWNALVYQVGDGIIQKDESGKMISGYNLKELKPYTEDIIEKIDKKNGATHYWLQKMKKAVPVVTADCVEVWGNNKKIVRVLLDGDTTTLIKAGYDQKLADQVFRPMPHDRINMIKTETAERKARLEDSKDVLAQITPFIVVGIAILGLVCIAYFEVQGAIKIAEYNDIIDQRHVDMWNSEATQLLKAHGTLIPSEQEKQANKEEPPSINP